MKINNKEEIIRLISEGILKDIVRFIESPNDECIACQIGEHWFYFIGCEDENMKPSEVRKSYTVEELSSLIYDAMIALAKDEYNYYLSYLNENLSKTLNTMNTFYNGFKIERDGEIITLTQKEMDEFIFLEKALVGKACVENYERHADKDELKYIQEIKEDKYACHNIQQEISEIMMEKSELVEKDVIADCIGYYKG